MYFLVCLLKGKSLTSMPYPRQEDGAPGAAQSDDITCVYLQQERRRQNVHGLEVFWSVRNRQQNSYLQGLLNVGDARRRQH